MNAIETWAISHGVKPKAPSFDFVSSADFDLDAGRAPSWLLLEPPTPTPMRGTGEYAERRAARVRELEARKEKVTA